MGGQRKVAKNRVNSYESIIEGYQLFHLLRQTADAIHKSREIELRKYGISPQQSGALVCIHSLGKKATSAELSRWLFRESNSLTVLLNRMHRLGLIKKTADTKKKNIIRLSLTKKGFEAYQHAVEFRTFNLIVNVLPERKRKQLWALLQLVREEVFKNLNLDVTSYSGSLEKVAFNPTASNIESDKKTGPPIP
jgi:DNA-binding MarR family transcriptional regulator